MFFSIVGILCISTLLAIGADYLLLRLIHWFQHRKDIHQCSGCKYFQVCLSVSAGLLPDVCAYWEEKKDRP